MYRFFYQHWLTERVHRDCNTFWPCDVALVWSLAIVTGQLCGGQAEIGRKWKVSMPCALKYCTLTSLPLLGLVEVGVYNTGLDSSFYCIPVFIISWRSFNFRFFWDRLTMKYALSLAALAAVASGHSIFGQIVVGGTQYRESGLQHCSWYHD